MKTQKYKAIVINTYCLLFKSSFLSLLISAFENQTLPLTGNRQRKGKEIPSCQPFQGLTFNNGQICECTKGSWVEGTQEPPLAQLVVGPTLKILAHSPK